MRVSYHTLSCDGKSDQDQRECEQLQTHYESSERLLCEIPCLVDSSGINPCYFGDLPP